MTLDLEEAARGVDKDGRIPAQQGLRHVQRHRQPSPARSARTCRHCGGHGQIVQSAGILRVQTTCPACHGAGSVITDPCETCRGRGYVPERVKLDVTIPAGIDDGMRVRIRRRRRAQPRRRPARRLATASSPSASTGCSSATARTWSCRCRSRYSQAALGATIEVPTLARPARADDSRRHAVGRGLSRPRPRHARPARRPGRRLARADVHRSPQESCTNVRKSCCGSWPRSSGPKSRRTASRFWNGYQRVLRSPEETAGRQKQSDTDTTCAEREHSQCRPVDASRGRRPSATRKLPSSKANSAKRQTSGPLARRRPSWKTTASGSQRELDEERRYAVVPLVRDLLPSSITWSGPSKRRRPTPRARVRPACWKA